ncbi:MAG TPA: hypothetical protein VN923_13265, partial [Thermoanaerobaculia bacterium]|nr:hypothetical protein [Thermoanaerobaculia bacterium]
VPVPNWGRDGQLLYACAGSSNGEVHGFFADANGDHPVFARMAIAGSAVSAVASLSGAEVLIGCADGRILVLDSATGVTTEQAQVEFLRSPIVRIEVLASHLAYALRKGDLLRWDGRAWSVVSRERGWQIFTVDRKSGHLFATTDADVFGSSDGGRTWKDASLGLPVRPHCTDLRVGLDADGGRTLYLATWGRSAWRARIAAGPDRGPDFELPPQARDVLFGVLEDGGGVVRVGGRIIHIPPHEPARDVFAALATAETAAAMEPEAAREVRRTVLQQLVRIARLALERLG